MKKFLLPVVTAGLIFTLYQFSSYSVSPKRVQLVMPSVQSIQETVTLHGTVTDPSPTRIYAYGPAAVLDIYVKPGDTVRKGDALAHLQPVQDVNTIDSAAVTTVRQIKRALEQGDLAAVEAAYTALDSADFMPDDTTQNAKAYFLYSTVNGIVLSVSASAGEQIGSVFPILEVCEPEKLVVTVSAGEDAIGKLEEAQRCTIAVPAFNLENLRGEVSTILPYAKKAGLFSSDTEAETEVQIRLTESSGLLRPGYRATAKIVLAEKSAALLIPYEAVAQDEQGREYVLKYADGYAVKQYILTSAELYDSIEIIEGLTRDDLIFLYPETTKEGSAVQLETH